ncbi:hypothetical protein RIF23_03550 [Lipingzhangella sp. LS1_29]|uniref:Uncharacterized protein n=1 Tax=Lipingzhangella rawalii TaxID=2055835 RepID=A0ABU2H243_9ACTN|nr:hypothetical protein [Lipingzhangella rawalii]MDS1269366.1 hypothetical protein [Lipingzhangella rawalii]
MSSHYPEQSGDTDVTAQQTTDSEDPHGMTGDTGTDAPSTDPALEAPPDEETATTNGWARPQHSSVVAETCAAAGLLLIVAVLVGAQPLHILAQLTASGPNAQAAHMMLADGAQALGATLLGITALLSLRPTTGTWVRWVSGATIVVGICYVLIVAAGYPMVPPDVPQPAPEQPMPMPE